MKTIKLYRFRLKISLFCDKNAGDQPRQDDEGEAMGKTLQVGGPATYEEIGAAYQASRAPQERERLLAIRMGQQGEWKTAKEIRRWLQRERGIELKLGGVYDWLNRLEARWKVPRNRHKKKTLPKKRRLNESLYPSWKPWPYRQPSESR